MKKLINQFSKLKIKKNEDYHSHTRYDLLRYVINRPARILDVGCGIGLTSELFKNHFAAEYSVGIEIDKSAAEKAKNRLDKVIMMDLNEQDFSWDGEKFDLIILGDLIEHLNNPRKFLLDLKNLLEQNGIIVISVPNIRNWRIIWMLAFKGDWKYTDFGIMDKTHLRFFTWKSLKEMVNDCGYKIVKTGNRKRIFDSIINILTLNIFKQFFINQFYLTLSLED